MKGGDELTIKEIAKLAGVSTATVSKVLNGKDQNISSTTRDRVLKVVDEEGYIPNSIARSLKMKETKTLGLIVPDVVNQFFSELARGVEDAAKKEGYTVFLCNTDNDSSKEQDYIRVLEEKMVDGIILAPSERTDKINLNKKTNVVIIDRDINIKNKAGKIGIDNELASYKATTYLIDKGCKKIGFISSGSKNITMAERLNGYKKALLEADLDINESMIYLENYDVSTGYKGTYEILKNNKIDAICCGNDFIAIGAMKAIKENGYRVPEDIKIIGIDDIEMAKYMDPALTTVKQPIYIMGENAVQMLLNLIKKEKTELIKILDTEIIERSSS